jgi:hypothetical protein
VDLPMAVGMQKLLVVGRVRTASAAPDPMVDLAVSLCYPQRLTADHASYGRYRKAFSDEWGWGHAVPEGLG